MNRYRRFNRNKLLYFKKTFNNNSTSLKTSVNKYFFRSYIKNSKQLVGNPKFNYKLDSKVSQLSKIIKSSINPDLLVLNKNRVRYNTLNMIRRTRNSLINKNTLDLIKFNIQSDKKKDNINQSMNLLNYKYKFIFNKIRHKTYIYSLVINKILLNTNHLNRISIK